jgi:phospholipid-binding lipoprotein MlaA
MRGADTLNPKSVHALRPRAPRALLAGAKPSRLVREVGWGEKGGSMRRGWGKFALLWLLPLLASACALPRDPSLPVSDPHEATNRKLMETNQQVLRPLSEVVKVAVPGPVHDRVHDFNSNLREPRIFANDVLQGRFDAAGRTAGRFVLNSTFGVGGLFDIASREGIPQQTGDFGQTLFVWGVSEGPYVGRPYLGPSTLRDAVGSAVDIVGNPLGWVIGTQLWVTVGSTTLDAVDRLGQLKAAEDASIDFYSFVRSSYYQMRRAELREALRLPNTIESPATSDLEDGMAEADPAPAPAGEKSKISSAK